MGRPVKNAARDSKIIAAFRAFDYGRIDDTEKRTTRQFYSQLARQEGITPHTVEGVIALAADEIIEWRRREGRRLKMLGEKAGRIRAQRLRKASLRARLRKVPK